MNKGIINLSVVILVLGLAFLALYFHSFLCGFGAVLAFSQVATLKIKEDK